VALLVVHRRTPRWPWIPPLHALILAAAGLALAATADGWGERVLFGACGIAMLGGAAEGIVRLRASGPVLVIREDGIHVASVGFVRWPDVAALHLLVARIGVDLEPASSAWQGLAWWRRLLARLDRTVRGPHIGWSARRLDQPADAILEAVRAAPAAVDVRLVLPKRALAT
jgi:hypothetical protein